MGAGVVLALSRAVRLRKAPPLSAPRRPVLLNATHDALAAHAAASSETVPYSGYGSKSEPGMSKPGG